MNPAQKAEPVTIDDDMSDSKKADLMWDWYSKTENSVIKDLFVGQLRSTLKVSTGMICTNNMKNKTNSFGLGTVFNMRQYECNVRSLLGFEFAVAFEHPL
jgi:ubiquitin C-terminal hydrolase